MPISLFIPAREAVRPIKVGFSGIEHTDKYLTGMKLGLKLKKQPNNLVGTLPAALHHIGRDEELLTAFNQLGDLFRDLDVKNLPVLEGRLLDRPFRLERLGSGKMGVGYRLDYQGQTYVFKTFKHRMFNTFSPRQHGPAGEMATGLFLSNFQINDCAKFYCGNFPLWSLLEFILPDARPEQREGRPLAEISAEQGLVITDRKHHNENPHGVRYDIGGICAPSLMLNIMENPTLGRKIARFWNTVQAGYQKFSKSQNIKQDEDKSGWKAEYKAASPEGKITLLQTLLSKKVPAMTDLAGHFPE